MRDMSGVSRKMAAMLTLALLLVGGQCVAFCSTAICAELAMPAAQQQESSSHCHQHGGEPPQHKENHEPACPHRQHSFIKSMDSYASSAKLVLHELASMTLQPEAGRISAPALIRSNETISPPRLTLALVLTTVLRV
jgi:hypothetical protein